jgi:hypothetical protein
VYLADVSGGYKMATSLLVKPEMRLEPWDAYLTSALAIVNCEPPRIMQLCGSTLHRHEFVNMHIGCTYLSVGYEWLDTIRGDGRIRTNI